MPRVVGPGAPQIDERHGIEGPGAGTVTCVGTVAVPAPQRPSGCLRRCGCLPRCKAAGWRFIGRGVRLAPPL